MKKTIYLNREDLREVVKKTVRNVVREGYQLTDPDEIMEYLWLKPKYTGLKVDIFVDDGGSFKRHRHKPLLLVRNGYDKTADTFIPFLLSKNPIILDTSIVYNISYNEIFAVQDFITYNLDKLIMLANKAISHKDFISSIKIPAYVITENKALLNEMATLRAKDSGLPMDVWLDEGATFQGHAPRLKFRASNKQRTTREFSSMLLMNPPIIENMPKNSPLKKGDIEKLEAFAVENLDLLLNLANGKIDYAEDFLPNMKKII